ncbi:MAG: hypothetical protein ABL931_24150 [Usitatibacteraceae bacterium]
MKTEINSSNKHNIALSTIVVAGLLFLASGIVNGSPAVSSEVAKAAVQKVDVIVVTAPRSPDAKLDTILVTARRTSPNA